MGQSSSSPEQLLCEAAQQEEAEGEALRVEVASGDAVDQLHDVAVPDRPGWVAHHQLLPGGETQEEVVTACSRLIATLSRPSCWSRSCRQGQMAAREIQGYQDGHKGELRAEWLRALVGGCQLFSHVVRGLNPGQAGAGSGYSPPQTAVGGICDTSQCSSKL